MAREMHVSERNTRKASMGFIAIRKYFCENWGLTLSLPNFRRMGSFPRSNAPR
jgi:hypothetical protein